MLSELCNQILTWTNLQTVPVRVPAMQDKVMLCSSGPDYRGASLDGQADEFYVVSTEFSQSDITEECCVQVEEVKVEDEEEEVEEPVTAVAVELKEARGPCGLQGSIALHATSYLLARAASCRSRVICHMHVFATGNATTMPLLLDGQAQPSGQLRLKFRLFSFVWPN